VFLELYLSLVNTHPRVHGRWHHIAAHGLGNITHCDGGTDGTGEGETTFRAPWLEQGGPLPVISSVITPLIGVTTPVSHVFSAIYKAPWLEEFSFNRTDLAPEN